MTDDQKRHNARDRAIKEALESDEISSEYNDEDDDPEGWRIYNDVVDTPQIEWLRKHPQHDHDDVLGQIERGEVPSR